jgi:hypothetical protein
VNPVSQIREVLRLQMTARSSVSHFF